MDSGRAVAAVTLACLAVLAGCAGGAGTATEPRGSLEPVWLSDTARNISGNHHAAVGAVVAGEPLVFAPISGRAGGESDGHAGHEHGGRAAGCVLYALDGTSGDVRWVDPVPPENCTLHAVADPAVADLVGGDQAEVLAASTTETVVAYDALTGAVVFEQALTAYGYTRPLAADFDGDGANELVAADIRGVVVAVQPDGTVVWNASVGADVQAQPHAVDVAGDERPEVVLGLLSGEVVALGPDGQERWRTRATETSVTWQATGQADADDKVETAVASFGGQVAMLDDDGAVVWSRDVGTLAAVHAFTDGDGDGQAELYVVDRNGTLQARTAADGTVEWETDLVEGEAQMTPPPVAADLDGDGETELAVALNSGRVVVVDAATGTVQAEYARDVPVWTHPTTADLVGDGAAELVVTYGDGRVAVLEFTPPEG